MFCWFLNKVLNLSKVFKLKAESIICKSDFEQLQIQNIMAVNWQIRNFNISEKRQQKSVAAITINIQMVSVARALNKIKIKRDRQCKDSCEPWPQYLWYFSQFNQPKPWKSGVSTMLLVFLMLKTSPIGIGTNSSELATIVRLSHSKWASATSAEDSKKN